MNKLSHKRLVDRLIDAYVSWREACLQVSDAYGSWANETGLGATSAFGRYMAALDREERAARTTARTAAGVRPGWSPSAIPGGAAWGRPRTAQRSDGATPSLQASQIAGSARLKSTAPRTSREWAPSTTTICSSWHAAFI